MRRYTLIACGLALPILLAACGQTPSRAGKLLTIAGEEANLIDMLDARLVRQLNIADLQIQAGQKSEAIKTLTLAAGTLKMEEKDPKRKLDDFRRIAGWTSVAQLNRRAGDEKAGLDAYLSAVEALNSVDPVSKRAEYVLSLSQICFEIRGKAETVALLVKGGEWAGKISDIGVRRYALWTFSEALVRYDDLEAARAVMRNEPDAGWRSDALVAMGQREIHNSNNLKSSDTGFATFALARNGARDMATPAMDAVQADESSRFNKNVQYEYNFRQEKLQQGLRPQ